MPINACSINAFTINALRCRSITPVRTTYDTVKRPQSIPSIVNQRRYVERDELVDDRVAENLFIEIKIELMGAEYNYSAENLPYDGEPIVYATNITMANVSPFITIENLQMLEIKYE